LYACKSSEGGSGRDFTLKRCGRVLLIQRMRNFKETENDLIMFLTGFLTRYLIGSQ
jgi:hypothetical protein